jgi:hypothetical protein
MKTLFTIGVTDLTLLLLLVKLNYFFPFFGLIVSNLATFLL